MSNEVKNITEEQSSYQSILKATSLFGGVQVYQIIIQVIKSKFIAVLLGPEGVGIQNLLTSSMDLVKSVTSLGVSQSAVRDVSAANANGDRERIGRTIAVLRKMIRLTGVIGLIAVIALSPLLSEFAFGNKDYTASFIILSVTLLLDQICAGQKTILQGMRKLLYLAKASAIGVTVGLFVTVPCYYLFRLKGIVPTLILHSLVALVFTWIYARKMDIENLKVDWRAALKEGSGMVKMGVAMSISAILTTLVAFVLRGFISRMGGVEEVGLFSAGYALMASYTGLVFSAMATDYYPRLAAVSSDNKKSVMTANQQAEIGVLILSPLLLICIIFVPIVVRILYSEAFLPVNDYIVWSAAGMIFKMTSWSMSYLFVAKGEAKLFIINETITSIYALGLNILGYYWGGLQGLGLSFLLNYLIYLIQVFIICKKRYDYSFSGSFLRIFVISSILLAATTSIFCIIKIVWLKYIIGSAMIAVSFIYSFIELDRRINLTSFIRNKLSR